MNSNMVTIGARRHVVPAKVHQFIGGNNGTRTRTRQSGDSPDVACTLFGSNEVEK